MSDAAVTSVPNSAVNNLKAIVGQKIGMTQVYAHGVIVPVTVIQAGPCNIIQIMNKGKHGYEAVQVGFGAVKEKNQNKPMAGQFKKVSQPQARWVREIRTDKAQVVKVGDVINVETFSPGDFVDVSGVSKGKGFAGAMKRHNFGGGPSTHGQSDRQRAPGSSGSNTYPGRVFKGKKFPGHLGSEGVTVQHLEVVEVLSDKNLLLLKGAVPGPNQGLVLVKQTVKRIKTHTERALSSSKKDKGAKKDAGKAPAAAPKAKGAK